MHPVTQNGYCIQCLSIDITFLSERIYRREMFTTIQYNLGWAIKTNHIFQLINIIASYEWQSVWPWPGNAFRITKGWWGEPITCFDHWSTKHPNEETFEKTSWLKLTSFVFIFKLPLWLSCLTSMSQCVKNKLYDKILVCLLLLARINTLLQYMATYSIW